MLAVMGRKAKEPTSSHSFRFPVRVIKALEALADRSHRSTNGEIILAVENHLRANGCLPAPEPPPEAPAPKPKTKKPKK